MRSSSIVLALLGTHHASGFVVNPGKALARGARCGGASVAMDAAAPATAPKLVPFSKYQGLGNDFILVDNREEEEPMLTAGESANLCDR